MIPLLSAYLAAGAAFAVVDAIWLTQVGPRLYRPALDAVLAELRAIRADAEAAKQRRAERKASRTGDEREEEEEKPVR